MVPQYLMISHVTAYMESGLTFNFSSGNTSRMHRYVCCSSLEELSSRKWGSHEHPKRPYMGSVIEELRVKLHWFVPFWITRHVLPVTDRKIPSSTDLFYSLFLPCFFFNSTFSLFFASRRIKDLMVVRILWDHGLVAKFGCCSASAALSNEEGRRKWRPADNWSRRLILVLWSC